MMLSSNAPTETNKTKISAKELTLRYLQFVSDNPVYHDPDSGLFDAQLAQNIKTLMAMLKSDCEVAWESKLAVNEFLQMPIVIYYHAVEENRSIPDVKMFLRFMNICGLTFFRQNPDIFQEILGLASDMSDLLELYKTNLYTQGSLESQYSTSVVPFYVDFPDLLDFIKKSDIDNLRAVLKPNEGSILLAILISTKEIGEIFSNKPNLIECITEAEMSDANFVNLLFTNAKRVILNRPELLSKMPDGLYRSKLIPLCKTDPDIHDVIFSRTELVRKFNLPLIDDFLPRPTSVVNFHIINYDNSERDIIKNIKRIVDTPSLIIAIEACLKLSTPSVLTEYHHYIYTKLLIYLNQNRDKPLTVTLNARFAIKAKKDNRDLRCVLNVLGCLLATNIGRLTILHRPEILQFVTSEGLNAKINIETPDSIYTFSQFFISPFSFEILRRNPSIVSNIKIHKFLHQVPYFNFQSTAEQAMFYKEFYQVHGALVDQFPKYLQVKIRALLQHYPYQSHSFSEPLQLVSIPPAEEISSAQDSLGIREKLIPTYPVITTAIPTQTIPRKKRRNRGKAKSKPQDTSVQTTSESMHAGQVHEEVPPISSAAQMDLIVNETMVVPTSYSQPDADTQTKQEQVLELKQEQVPEPKQEADAKQAQEADVNAKPETKQKVSKLSVLPRSNIKENRKKSKPISKNLPEKSGLPSQPQEHKNNLRDAIKLFKINKYHEALLVFKQRSRALSKIENLEYILQCEANLQLSTNTTIAAFNALTTSCEEKFKFALLCDKVNLTYESEMILKSALSQSENDLHVRERLIKKYKAENRKEDILTLCLETVNKFQADTKAFPFCQIAFDIFGEQEEYSKAINLMTQNRRWKNYPHLHKKLAYYTFLMGEHIEAITILEGALKQYPKDMAIFVAYCEFLLRTDPSKLTDRLAIGLKLFPAEKDVFIKLNVELHQDDDLEKCILILKNRIKEPNPTLDHYLNLIRLHLLNQDVPAASQLMDECKLVMMQTNLDPHLNWLQEASTLDLLSWYSSSSPPSSVLPVLFDKRIGEIFSWFEEPGKETYLAGSNVKVLVWNKLKANLPCPIKVSDHDYLTNITTESKFTNAQCKPSPKTAEIFEEGVTYYTSDARGHIDVMSISDRKKWLAYLRKKRGFTIFAVLADKNERAYDLTGFGFHDIKHKILRAIGNPYAVLKEDPSRLLKLIRYKADGFKVEASLEKAMHICRPTQKKDIEHFKQLLKKYFISRPKDAEFFVSELRNYLQGQKVKPGEKGKLGEIFGIIPSNDNAVLLLQLQKAVGYRAYSQHHAVTFAPNQAASTTNLQNPIPGNNLQNVTPAPK